MTVDGWRRVKDIFSGALERPPALRGTFITSECGADLEIRREVESLLSAHDTAGDFLERPAASVQALAFAGLANGTPAQLHAGDRLGPYEIVAEIGAGGMGEVYRARDTRLDRTVALKILRQPIAPSPDDRQRFEHEARTISSLNHPHICDLYDVGRHEAIDFLVMEYLEGETLAAHLARGPLSPADIIRHAIEIASALETAHQHGIIHRDLKPSNIVITPHGAKLLDFGIAKLQEEGGQWAGGKGASENLLASSPPSPRNTNATRGRFMGTVAYMSPEQIAGASIDARSDLFSFGTLLHEMATGRRPFDGGDSETISRAIVEQPAPPIDERASRLPRGFAAVVGKALEKDRARRYQSADDLRADLQGLFPATGGAQRVRRSRAIVLATVGVAAVVAGAIVLPKLWSRGASTSERRSVAVLPFRPITNDSNRRGPDDRYIGISLADALIGELDRVSAISVRPLSAINRYDQPNRDPVAIGHALNVDLVLDGAIERTGQDLHVRARLVRVADGQAIWSDRFDSTWSNVFGVQDAIAGHVVQALAGTATAEERKTITRRRTGNPDAYEAYLRGRYFWNLRTPDGFGRALVYFQRAIDVDPGYARAYAGLADTYALLGSVPYATMPPVDASGRARAAAEKALAIDDTLAEAQLSLAFVMYSFEWEFADAERGFRHAIELDPEYAPAHYWYSLYLGHMGRFTEQLVEAQRALQLEPLSLIGTYSVGLAHYFARHYDAALQYANSALEISATFPPARRLRGSIEVAQGRLAEGAADLSALYEAAPDNSYSAALAAEAYGLSGNVTKARAIVAQLLRDASTRYVPAAHIAVASIGVGNNDEVFKWLEKGFAERSQALTFLKVDPVFDPVRNDPRFNDLMKRVGF